LVYHLYGLDKYPESLVLTEDDYLDFLIKASEENFEVRHSDQQKRMPSSVLKALSGTSLMLLGYDVYSWEFRALFRGLIKARNDSRANNRNIAEGISMQIEADRDYTDPAKVKTYLAKYFKQAHFKVYWGDLEACVEDLWKIWKG
ncbi:MAG: SIR2 family protein, partial [Chloroflexota bacterium]